VAEEAYRTRLLLESDDERTRAVAARSVCVCHGSFDLFSELGEDLERLAATDESARVRREAKHVLRDPLVVNRHDDERVERNEARIRLQEYELARQKVAADRALRRSRGAGRRARS
jgi:hypothetical protein